MVGCPAGFVIDSPSGSSVGGFFTYLGEGYVNLLIWMFPRIGGFFPKMDGENHGKPY